MITRMTWLCVAALLAATPMWAQSTDDAAPSRYVGVVTGDRVNVRAGPETGYIVTQLSSPAQVTVLGKVPGWLKIAPPADTFGVISKDYVQPDATGKVGTVTGDNVYVRAGGPRRQASFDIFLLRLGKGDKVEISGEIGTFYKIVPPAGSHFWVSDQYVRPLTAAPAGPATPPVPTERTLTPPPEAPGDVVVPGATTRAAPPPDAPVEPAAPPAAEQTAGLREAEEVWKREMAKPHDQRDYTGMLQKYQAVEVPAGNAMASVVQAKVRYLQEMLRYQKETEEIDRLVREARTTTERFEQAREDLAAATPATRPVTRYAAQGILSPSDLFPGTGAVPKRWIVRDPQTLRVDAYVQATGGQVELKRYAGKHVGIHGKAVYDAALGLDIVEATSVTVLNEKVDLPGPPKPITKTETPQPKLAPTPPVDVPGLGKPGEKPAPAKPAPLAPAPLRSAPVTPPPVAPPPVMPTPARPAPPVTPLPVTPAPVTPAPVAPPPVTPAPVTPTPAKPAPPVTPLPVKPLPVTPLPAKPATPVVEPPRPDADAPIFVPEPAPAPATQPAVVPIPPPPPVDTRVIVIPGPTTKPAELTTKPAEPTTRPAPVVPAKPVPPPGMPLE